MYDSSLPGMGQLLGKCGHRCKYIVRAWLNIYIYICIFISCVHIQVKTSGQYSIFVPSTMSPLKAPFAAAVLVRLHLRTLVELSFE